MRLTRQAVLSLLFAVWSVEGVDDCPNTDVLETSQLADNGAELVFVLDKSLQPEHLAFVARLYQLIACYIDQPKTLPWAINSVVVDQTGVAIVPLRARSRGELNAALEDISNRSSSLHDPSTPTAASCDAIKQVAVQLGLQVRPNATKQLVIVDDRLTRRACPLLSASSAPAGWQLKPVLINGDLSTTKNRYSLHFDDWKHLQKTETEPDTNPQLRKSRDFDAFTKLSAVRRFARSLIELPRPPKINRKQQETSHKDQAQDRPTTAATTIKEDDANLITSTDQTTSSSATTPPETTSSPTTQKPSTTEIPSTGSSEEASTTTASPSTTSVNEQPITTESPTAAETSTDTAFPSTSSTWIQHPTLHLHGPLELTSRPLQSLLRRPNPLTKQPRLLQPVQHRTQLPARHLLLPAQMVNQLPLSLKSLSDLPKATKSVTVTTTTSSVDGILPKIDSKPGTSVMSTLDPSESTADQPPTTTFTENTDNLSVTTNDTNGNNTQVGATTAAPDSGTPGWLLAVFIGAFILLLLIGALGVFLFVRRNRKKRKGKTVENPPRVVDHPGEPLVVQQSSMANSSQIQEALDHLESPPSSSNTKRTISAASIGVTPAPSQPSVLSLDFDSHTYLTNDHPDPLVPIDLSDRQRDPNY